MHGALGLQQAEIAEAANIQHRTALARSKQGFVEGRHQGRALAAFEDTGPLTFAAPPGLDEKGARDWRKIAEKVAEREFAPALGKLREFERKHGATDETARLRAWLEQQR